MNALYHRGYDEDSPHTTLVRITSDRIDIRSTPGPVPGVGRDELVRGATPRLAPPRSPRAGELFKEIELAEKRLTHLATDIERPAVVVPWLEALIADGQGERAHRFLEGQSSRLSEREAAGAAIVARRIGDEDLAARLFGNAGSAILDDPRALLESARNKLWLAGNAHREGSASDNRRLLEDARTLLKRLLGMDAPRRRHAWAWRELGRVRRWLREPASAVDDAYASAIRLAPDETKFREERRQRR